VGQLFSKDTQAIFYNWKQLPVQRMLDFDFLCGRKTPSVAVIVQPGSGGGFQKLFFGQEEIAIPQASWLGWGSMAVGVGTASPN
jgi:ATP citrate (pro-S)-lyase